MEQLTPEDMSNLFFEFNIPSKLYGKWAVYSKETKQSMNSSLTELLHSCAPGQYYDPATSSPPRSYQHVPPHSYLHSQPHMITFSLRYTKPLREEIFNIFMQTGYKNNTNEMNNEIIKRLEKALEIKDKE